MTWSNKNPFRNDRVNSVQDFHPEWDVATLHEEVTNRLEAAITSIVPSPIPDSSRKVFVIKAAPGWGKSHLFGRLAHQLECETLTVFIPQINPNQPPHEHFRWHLVETLFTNQSRQGATPLELALAKLSRPSFYDYFGWLPRSVQSAHHQLGERLRDDSGAVLDVVRGVSIDEPFETLADHIAKEHPPFAEIPFAIARALALGWAPKRLRNIARAWLRGDSISDEDCEKLNLPEEPPLAESVFQGVSALFNHSLPIILCCDQLEGILGDSQATTDYTDALVLLLQKVPNLQIVVACLEDRWDAILQNSQGSFSPRCEVHRLDDFLGSHATLMLSRRLASVVPGPHDPEDTSPFDRSAWSRYVDENRPPVRNFLNCAATQYEEWLSRGRPAELITPENHADPEQQFRSTWEQELEAIRRDPNRSPENLQESDLYAMLLEAFRTLSVCRHSQYPAIDAIEGDVIPQTNTYTRYGMNVTVAGASIVIAATKVASGREFRFYFTALQTAMQKTNAKQVIILHPTGDIPMGAKTKESYDTAHAAGKIRTISIQDFLPSFEHLHCHWSLLREAGSQALVCGEHTLTIDDCRDWIVKLGQFDELSLLQSCLASVTEQVSSPPARTTSSPAIAAQRTVTTAARKPIPSTTSTLESDSAPIDVSSHPDNWAEKQLTVVVNQLHDLRVKVARKSFQIGPNFARLLVTPVGNTTINKVRNRAEDLKIRLGLEHSPFVDSAAGAICIDVELPPEHKQPVTLAEALLEPPAVPETTPIFPVGKDVSGETKWADLSNSNECHFLVAGTTGSGKSELLKIIIAALARRLPPKRLQFVLIDPKRVTFNFGQSTSPYFRHPIANTVDEALPLLSDVFKETERRFELLQQQQLDNLDQLQAKTGDAPPRIVLICDEFADLMADKETKADLEQPLKQLSSKARAAGIHLILATQRPEANVVTPLIRSNLPGRICLRVKSKGDSSIVMNRPDACELLGKGDLLWERGAGMIRLQSPLATREELEDALRF